MTLPRPTDILDFWFSPAARPHWFVRSDAFDAEVVRRMGPAYELAARGELDAWAARSEGSLALILLLDQAPRNMFRASPRAFLTDAKALDITRNAIGRSHDRDALLDRRIFYYLPFEHSESVADQDRCCELVAAMGNAEFLKYAELHRDIILRFGRFPHRNAVLGRESTQEEIAFLKEPNSSF